MAKREQMTVGELTLAGIYQVVGTHSVYVLARNSAGYVMICVGADVPHDGDAGFAAGCMFVKSDGAIYFNAGTTAAANFDLQGVVAAGSVTLAMLHAGITPSHIVVAAGLSVAEADADATVTIADAGFLETDIGLAVYAAGANDVYVKKVVMAAGTMTVTLSGNGGAGTQVAYQVLRAAA